MKQKIERKMSLAEAEDLVDQFMLFKNKRVMVDDLLVVINEIQVQLVTGADDLWKPIMICTEIDSNNKRKKKYDMLFTLSYDFLKTLSANENLVGK